MTRVVDILLIRMNAYQVGDRSCHVWLDAGRLESNQCCWTVVVCLFSYSNDTIIRKLQLSYRFGGMNSETQNADSFVATLTVCASDKRIACDEEFSDSEDEGDGRRHRESFKAKRPRIEEKADTKIIPPTGKHVIYIAEAARPV